MTPNPGVGPVVLQPIGQLLHFFNQGGPFDGDFPDPVEAQQFAFWFSRAGAISTSMNVSETVTGSSFAATIVVLHGTTTNIAGVQDNIFAAGDYTDLLTPAGDGLDWRRAVWDHRFERTDAGPPVIGEFRYEMLKGIGWPGFGNWNMQWKVSGRISPVDNVFPFSTRAADFNDPVPTGIIGTLTGTDPVRGETYQQLAIPFFEEATTESGLTGAIDMVVSSWFPWRAPEPPNAALYNAATGAYSAP